MFVIEQLRYHTTEVVVLSTDIVYNIHMNDIYQEHILDHANNPRNKVSGKVAPGGTVEVPNALLQEGVCGQGDNPSCGDEGELCVEVQDGIITNVKWSGRGCAISQASMSMMSELLIGKNIKELKLMMPGDVYKMLGIQITPSRVNCALLPYRALENILFKIML